MRTGKRLGPALSFTKGGCNYAVANAYLMLFRDESASYVDLASGKKQDLYAVRSGCSNSLIAADGLLSVPNFAVGCVCNYPMQTSFALAPTGREELARARGEASQVGQDRWKSNFHLMGCDGQGIGSLSLSLREKIAFFRGAKGDNRPLRTIT